MDNNCLVCFTETNEGKFITCSDPTCTARICIECAPFLFSFSEKEEIIPKCPSPKCDTLYLLSDISRVLEKSVIDIYCKACYKNLSKENGEIISKIDEYEKILIKIREEREKFLKENFPKSVTLVINVGLQGKIRQITRDRAKYIKERINQTNKRCMNLTCTGYLNEKMQCLICLTKFCPNCEKILTEKHKCSKEEIKTLNIVKKMVKCPVCKFPIEKSEGCNTMTCTNCCSQFDYITGKSLSSPYELSHNREQIYVKETYNIASTYKDMVDKKVLLLLEKFVELKPEIIDNNKEIIKILRKKPANKEWLITRKFEQYMACRYKMRYYQKCAYAIGEAIRERKYPADEVKAIIATICS